MSLSDPLATAKILVVVGSGGVGKTSVSASLALAAAEAGRKTIVLTIDPARRLATALGLGDQIAHDRTSVELPSGATMDAAMLDMRSSWDSLLDRYAPNPGVATRLRANPLYASLADHFVGSQGYMAMERLAALHDSGDYDLIVIDTPPTRNALDFLDAPKRMTDFIGGSLLKWLAKPYTAAGKVGLRAFNVTATPFLKIADKVLGSALLQDLSSFVMDFQTMYDAFKKRADEVLVIMAQPSTAFVVVTTLEGPPLQEAGFFIDRLVDERLHLAGVVANRVTPQRFTSADVAPALEALENPDIEAIAEAAKLSEADASKALAESRDALRTLSALGQRDADRLSELSKRSRADVTAVEVMTSDIHDLKTLGVLAQRLTS